MFSASSAVTYTSVYTDSKPGRVFWGADEELSDGGSPRVIMYGYDGFPMLPVAPPSPDYIPGPEEPQTPPAPQDEDEHEPRFIQSHDPDFMPEPIYPEYIPLDEEHILPAKEQPLLPVVTPTAESPGCTAPAALPLPQLPPPLHMPPPINCRDDIPDTELPPRKRLCLSTLGSRYEAGESSTARPIGDRGIDYGFVSTLDAKARRRGIREVGYGIRDTWIDPAEIVPELAPMTVGEMQRTEIAELRETDRKRHAQMAETLRVMGDMRREMGDIQAELQIMAPVSLIRVRGQGSSTLPNNTDANNMTPKSVHAMIDQALLRNSTNRDGSHSSHEDNRRNVQTTRPYFYADFMKYEPLNFKGTKGVVGLTRWIENMESVFQISGCAFKNQFVADETEKIDKYVSGLSVNIYGSVKSLKPKTLDETIELANDLMDQKLRTYAERQSNNKRKADESFRNNH
nr:hypothetical protein [Tanacetum cinerariifolium]